MQRCRRNVIRAPPPPRACSVPFLPLSLSLSLFVHVHRSSFSFRLTLRLRAIADGSLINFVCGVRTVQG